MEELIESYPYLLPIVFISFWCFVLSILARLSGWAKLAEYYRAEGEFDGARRHFQSMSMGRRTLMDVNFNNCVAFTVNAQTLRLSMFFLLRPFHPPLAIPLAELSTESHRMLLGFETIRITARRVPDIRITMLKSQARWLAEHSHGRWPTPAEAAAG